MLNNLQNKNLRLQLLWTLKQQPNDPIGEKQSMNTPFSSPTIQPSIDGSAEKGKEIPLYYLP